MSVKTFINERRTSFVFAIGSIIYGVYHFFNPHVITTSEAYETINVVLGAVGGRYFGIVFFALGLLKLVGMATNNKRIRLSAFFALSAAWSILSLCFFIAFLSGNQNAAWIYITMIVGMASTIIEKKVDSNQGLVK